MSPESECAAETIGTANQTSSPVQAAIELVKTAGPTETGAAAILCKKCGVTLDISTELGSNTAQLKLATRPADAAEACTEVRYKQVGDWVTNLSRRWFNVHVFEPHFKEDIEDSQGGSYSVSPVGLEIAINDIAHNLAEVRELQNQADQSHTMNDIRRLENQIAARTELLCMIFVRSDGRTWQQELQERSEQLN